MLPERWCGFGEMVDMSLEEQVEKRETRPGAPYMKPTDISDPDYFH